MALPGLGASRTGSEGGAGPPSWGPGAWVPGPLRSTHICREALFVVWPHEHAKPCREHGSGWLCCQPCCLPLPTPTLGTCSVAGAGPQASRW